MFYLTTHSTHFIYSYMASDIWLRTILIVRKETRCCHIGYSFRLTARVLLYAPSHRQDSTYHGLCYTSHGAQAGTRNSPMKDRSDDPLHHEQTLLPRSSLGWSQYQDVNPGKEGVVVIHLPTGPLKPALGWSRYRDVNPGQEKRRCSGHTPTHWAFKTSSGLEAIPRCEPRTREKKV